MDAGFAWNIVDFVCVYGIAVYLFISHNYFAITQKVFKFQYPR